MSAFVFGPHILTNTTASGRPFLARFRAMVKRNGVQKEKSGRIFRDSSGRLRVDMEFQGALIGYRVLDPIAGKRILVNHTTKTFVESAYGPALRFATLDSSSAKRMIEGLECLRYPPKQTLQEAWVSPELELVIQERTRDESGETAWERHDIVKAEPEESLFRIPSDYQAATGPDV